MPAADWKPRGEPCGLPFSERESVPPEGDPHGWLQWKGTSLCGDFYCKCGKHWHLDEEFVYYSSCPYCGQKYYLNAHIELVPISEEEWAKDGERYATVLKPGEKDWEQMADAERNATNSFPVSCDPCVLIPFRDADEWAQALEALPEIPDKLRPLLQKLRTQKVKR